MRWRRGLKSETSSFNPFDPIQDTERVYPGRRLASLSRFNPFDPIQDTERWAGKPPACSPGRVSTHSIRYRILKAGVDRAPWRVDVGFNPFDPIQDTESIRCLPVRWIDLVVSTHSIRYRILKGLLERIVSVRAISFNPFDPIQDTERAVVSVWSSTGIWFQPIRSDTGY